MSLHHSDKVYTIDEIKQIAGPIFDKAGFVDEAYVFGSYARGEADGDSDIDFMLKINKPLGSYFSGLYYPLEKMFEKDVDLLTDYEYDRLRYRKKLVKIYESK